MGWKWCICNFVSGKKINFLLLRIHSFLPYNSPGAGAGAVLFLKGRSRSRSRRKSGGSETLDYTKQIVHGRDYNLDMTKNCELNMTWNDWIKQSDTSIIMIDPNPPPRKRYSPRTTTMSAISLRRPRTRRGHLPSNPPPRRIHRSLPQISSIKLNIS